MEYPQKAHWKGKKHRPESILKMKAHSSWNKGKKMTVEYRRKLSELKKGEKHWNWKGGVSDINNRIRKSIEYRLWRESVFERDNYTCVWCGEMGVYLEPDHIKPFSLFPELRFAIDNGRTLCRECHSKTDTYKGKLNKKS